MSTYHMKDLYLEFQKQSVHSNGPGSECHQIGNSEINMEILFRFIPKVLIWCNQLIMHPFDNLHRIFNSGGFIHGVCLKALLEWVNDSWKINKLVFVVEKSSSKTIYCHFYYYVVYVFRFFFFIGMDIKNVKKYYNHFFLLANDL